MGDIVQFKPKKDKKIYIVLAVLIVATAILLYINIVHSAYTKSLNLNKSAIMSIEDSGYIFEKSGKEVVACGHEGITAIDKNGEIKWKTPFAASTPYMVTSGKYVLCADLNGNDCAVFVDGRKITEQKLPYEIITANLNENGYYAAATKERGYKAKVTVWNTKGEQVFAWHSTKYHVMAVAVANNNRGMIVSAFDIENTDGNMFKMLYFSFGKDTPTELECGEKNLVANLKSVGNRIYAIGDNAFYAYSESGRKAFNIDFDGRTLQRYATTDTVIALALTKTSVEGYYGGSVVETYSASGAKKGSYGVDDEITFLDMEENKVLVNSPDGAYILSDNGRLYGNLTFGNEVREGIIFSGGKKLLLVNGANVNIYDSK